MRTLTASLTAFLLVLNISLYSQNDFKLGFTGAYPHNYNNPFTLQHDWGWYNDLNMNAWSGWWMGGNWGTSASGTVEILSRFAFHNINGYLQPDTIRWAGYGRVLVTEAEETSDRFRYNFRRCGSNEVDITWGDGHTVSYYNKNSLCNEEQSPSGMILWGTNENCFQSIANFPYDPKYQVDFPFNKNPDNPYDPESKKYYNNYYVKPRMRISTSDVNNAPNKRVIKIIVNKYNGWPADTITIFTDNFKTNGTYDGSYKEDFANINFSIPGDVINEGRGDVFVPIPEVLANCKVDYQIYWYGEVSVWIDYVKVMDEAAYMLNNPDPCKRWRFENLLQKPLN